MAERDYLRYEFSLWAGDDESRKRISRGPGILTILVPRKILLEDAELIASIFALALNGVRRIADRNESQSRNAGARAASAPSEHGRDGE